MEEVRAQFPAAAPAFARYASAGQGCRAVALAKAGFKSRPERATTRQANSNKSRTSLCSRVSKTLLAWGSTRAACHILNLLGAWQKSDAPALQAGSSGRDTRRPPPFHCGENEIQASLISSASVGATPTPATNFREVIHLPDCKSGVVKQSWKR